MPRGISRGGLLAAVVARTRRERAGERACYYPLEAASAGTWTRRGSTALAAPGATRMNPGSTAPATLSLQFNAYLSFTK